MSDTLDTAPLDGAAMPVAPIPLDQPPIAAPSRQLDPRDLENYTGAEGWQEIRT